MKCPKCKADENQQRVLKTTPLDQSNLRRRICTKCACTFSTREKLDTVEEEPEVPRVQSA